MLRAYARCAGRATVWGRDRDPALEPGDVLAVLSADANGMAMASHYNTRSRAAEVMLDGDAVRLIRERELVRELFAHERLVPAPAGR